MPKLTNKATHYVRIAGLTIILEKLRLKKTYLSSRSSRGYHGGRTYIQKQMLDVEELRRF